MSSDKTATERLENELLRDKIADYDKMYTHICEQLASVKRSLAAARAENAKLRNEFRKMDEWHSKELVAAMDENAKLRELVRDMWPFAKEGSAHTCPDRECCLFEECDTGFGGECPIEEHMAARMRELGVEVPNGN